MNHPPIDLSIILPAYMEAAVISQALDKLHAFLQTRDYGNVEVVVVVADSPDGTAKLAEQKAHLFAHFQVVHAGPRVGKGRDVRLGIFEAHGHYRLFMDADLATPLHHLDAAVAKLQQGNAIVIATRDLWSIHKDILRKLMSSFGNRFIQSLILPGIKDTQCGFKGFSAEAAIAIFSRQTMLGWSFDAEILLIGRQLGYSITTIEVPDWTDPKAANMGLVGDSPLHAALKTFSDTLRIRQNAWAGRYKEPSYHHPVPAN